MNQRLKQYKKIRIILSVLLVVILLIGTSFAIFQNFARQSGTNNLGATNCFSVTFVGVNNAINLANDYPIPDSEGLERDPYTFKVTNNCNQYLTLSIGVETLSTSEIPSNLIKGVIVNNGGSPTSASILSSGKTMEAQNGGTAYELLTDGLGAKASKTYDLRLWFDESMTKEQGASKKYQGKVIVGASAEVEPAPAPNGWYEAGNGTLLAALRDSNTLKTPITTPGAEVSAYTFDDVPNQTASVSSTYQAYYITYGTGWEANGTNFDLMGAAVTSDTYANSYSSLVGKYLPNYSLYSAGSNIAGTMQTTTNLSSVYYVVSATQNSFVYKELSSLKNTIEAELASTEDDYGTSYYFRGAVTNNYVIFANKCWRIVRVGGDGSVKLILHNDNTTGAANPCDSANNSASAAFARYSGTTYTSKFNSNYTDNAYVGFMYGTPGSSTYEATHANTNKSTILTNLETWYNNKLKTYESVIDDTVWCNDKTNVTDTTYNPTNYGGNATGLGYGRNKTYYGAYQRLVSTSFRAGGTGPSLKCNGELSRITSKVGLITADELAFAGYAYQKGNTTTYLQENATSDYWWSLSPSIFFGAGAYGGSAYVWNVRGSSGIFDSALVNYSGTTVYGSYGLRPSISLKSTTNVTGDGTSDKPYKVV